MITILLEIEYENINEDNVTPLSSRAAPYLRLPKGDGEEETVIVLGHSTKGPLYDNIRNNGYLPKAKHQPSNK